MAWYRDPLFILLIIIGIVTLIVVIANIGITSVSSGKEFTSTMSFIAGFWWLFLSLGFLLLLLSVLLSSILAARIGLFLIFLGIFEVEILYILPLFGGYFDIFRGDLTLVDCSKIEPTQYLQYISCLFGGYAIESKNLWIGWIVWFVFLFITPLAILFSLFWEFSDFLTNRNVRNVVTFATSLIAYRALMSTIFIEILTYGAGGIALLLINWLFFGYIVRIVNRMFEHIEKAERVAEVVYRLGERRKQFYNAVEQSEHWKKLEDAIDKQNEQNFVSIVKEILPIAEQFLVFDDIDALRSKLSYIQQQMKSDKDKAKKELDGLKEGLKKGLKP